MRRCTALSAAIVLSALVSNGHTQPPARPAPPRLEPVAETKLLMEGLAHPNFKAVDRMLKGEPADVEAWQFARGQALLMAETANLLMIRPPKSQKAEETWMARATDLRNAAGILATNAGKGDLAKSRASLTNVAATCNRCHEAFRIDVRLKTSEVAK